MQNYLYIDNSKEQNNNDNTNIEIQKWIKRKFITKYINLTINSNISLIKYYLLFIYERINNRLINITYE